MRQRTFSRLDELTPARRAAILADAAEPRPAAALRGIARGLGVPLPDLAREAGLPLWRVERTLNGRREADAETMQAVSLALGVTPFDLCAARHYAAVGEANDA